MKELLEKAVEEAKAFNREKQINCVLFDEEFVPFDIFQTPSGKAWKAETDYWNRGFQGTENFWENFYGPQGVNYGNSVGLTDPNKNKGKS